MIVYGHQIESDEDVLVKIAEEVLVSAIDAPASHLVELLPALKDIPEWFPGAHDLKRVLCCGCVRSPMIWPKRRSLLVLTP